MLCLVLILFMWWFRCRNCYPDALAAVKVMGKILLCEDSEGDYLPKEKFELLKRLGVVGMILVDNSVRQIAPKFGEFPIAAVNKDDGSQILSYIKSTR